MTRGDQMARGDEMASRSGSGMTDTEQELLDRARGGSAYAFELLVREHDRRILTTILDMVGDPDDAQDVFQEAMLAAYRGLPRFRGGSRFSTWLFRIAVNKALHFRQRRQRSVSYEQQAATQAAVERPPERDAALETELREQFDRSLQQLSQRERAAVVLCHRQGYSVGEAAELMDCSAGSVKSYLFRGRGKLRTLLQPYLEE
jgi:RNA polymerase sigma-70 factor, ECF subfamily